MSSAVKKTISLPSDLARQVDEIAQSEGKTVSAVVQDALRLARREYLKREFRDIQGYWSTRARDKGILSERDMQRYLGD